MNEDDKYIDEIDAENVDVTDDLCYLFIQDENEDNTMEIKVNNTNESSDQTVGDEDE